MAAPQTTARLDPGGFKLQSGHQTLIAFASNPAVLFYERDVTPPGIDGGDPIDTTTQHNVTVTTMAPRDLFTLTNSTVVVAYDPEVYNDILALVNSPTSITTIFPDGATLDFWGYLKSFTPNALSIGEMPTANVEIVPTNYDPVHCVEAIPVMTSAGTCIVTGGDHLIH